MTWLLHLARLVAGGCKARPYVGVGVAGGRRACPCVWLALLAACAPVDHGPLFEPRTAAPAYDLAVHEPLPMELSLERLPTRRILTLSAGWGQAELLLDDPSEEGHGLAFLVAPDPLSATAFVQAVSSWAGVVTDELPSPVVGLDPWPLAYDYLGQEREGLDSWHVCKLYLADRRDSAELLLRVDDGGTRGSLRLPAGSEPQALTLLLGRALRDGALPPRSPASDPNISTLDPLIPGPRSVVTGGRAVDSFCWLGGWLVGADSQGLQSVLLVWDDPEREPVVLAEVPGRVLGLAAAPDGRTLAVQVVYPRDPEVWTSDDPSSLLVAERRGGRVRTLVGDAEGLQLREGCWSPESDRLAVVELVPAEDLRPRGVVRVVDAATGTTVARTAAELDLEPLRWDALGLLLARRDPLALERPAPYRWQPGHGEPRPVEALVWASPDGRFTVQAHAQGLLLGRRGGKPRVVRAAFDGDAEALAAWSRGRRPSWTGTHHLALLSGEEVLALDLSTGLWQPLSPVSTGLPIADRGGHRLVLRAGSEPWWGWAP